LKKKKYLKSYITIIIIINDTFIIFINNFEINVSLPIELYNKKFDKYTFYARDHPIEYWGILFCNFKNNKLKYEEVNATSETTNLNKYLLKYWFLYK
jgi:hypothetical protein